MTYRGNCLIRMIVLGVAGVLAPGAALFAQSAEPARINYDDVVAIEAILQYAAVRPGDESAVALHFKVKDAWHFYADPKTAPGGMNLKIKPQGEGIAFGEPVFPASIPYFDASSGKQLEVYGGEFVVYVPFTAGDEAGDSVEIVVGFDGAVCSETLCQRPPLGKLRLQVPVSADAAMDSPAFELPQTDTQTESRPAAVEVSSLTAWLALPLAVFGGLLLNLMPCVWPVLPIIVTRLLEQSRHSRGRSVGLGMAFAAGIVLFFVVLAGVNVVLRVGFGTVLQWGEPFRSPAFLIGMVLLLVVLAQFMFGVVTFAVPSSIAGRGGTGKGVGGSVATGFLAAVLATPCSFAPLTAAFAWAQTQPLVLSTAAILLIGAGMAVPYVVLTAIPGLLQAMPKAGRWMELLKQGLGFVLLLIAIELLSALPEVQQVATFYGAVVAAFCVWMWGGWVGYSTPPVKKWVIRGAAAGLAVAAGVVLFGPEERLIDWQQYDAARIREAVGRERPVLVEFTADWCLSCKVVEKTVYERQDVADLIRRKGVLAVRGDTTLRDYPAAVDLKDVYNEPAVPVTLLLLPGEAGLVRLRGLLIRDELVEALEALPDVKPIQGNELGK